MIGLTFVIEAVTCFFRFGLNLQSTRDTRFLRQYTANYRVHHGYVGAAMMVGAVPAWVSDTAQWTLIIGAALALSDLIHHFIVLRAATGHHEFDITYPKLVPIPVEREEQVTSRKD